MKNKILYWFLILLCVLTAGCEENGDSGYYNDLCRVYFKDTVISYEFGDKPIEMTKYTVKVPVGILGLPAEAGKIKVKVDTESTTAQPEFYSAIPEEISVAKDSVVVYVPVELLRANIPYDKDTTFYITLYLDPSGDYELGIKESLRARVTFRSYLPRPEWWAWFEYTVIGEYHPLKFQKWMEIWGRDITLNDVMFYYIPVMEACREMYDYFMEHPEYGMVFPENITWPYE